MNFCITYNYPNTLYLDKADEIKIIYRPQDTTLKAFLQKYKDKKILIEVFDVFKGGGTTLKFFQELKEDSEVPNNWTLQIHLGILKNYSNSIEKIKLEAVKDCCHNFMISEEISDWDSLDRILRLGVSEIYVTGELGFNLQAVRKQCKKYNTEDKQIKIRCIPNLIHYNTIIPKDKYSQYTDFFIRPEDTLFYSELIDSIEPYGITKEEIEVAFKAYAITKQWYGNLNEIITNLTVDIENRALVQRYGKYRSQCKRRCQKGSYCDLCKSIPNLAENLKEADLRIIPPSKLDEEEQSELAEEKVTKDIEIDI